MNIIQMIFILDFVKHDLKGVLKCIRVKIWTHSPPPPPQTVTDKATKTVTDRDRHRTITDRDRYSMKNRHRP